MADEKTAFPLSRKECEDSGEHFWRRMDAVDSTNPPVYHEQCRACGHQITWEGYERQPENGQADGEAPSPPTEGQPGGSADQIDGECSRCDADAVWENPTDGTLFCTEHSREFFRERHG